MNRIHAKENWTATLFALGMAIALIFTEFFSLSLVKAESLTWRDFAYQEAYIHGVKRQEMDQLLTARLDTHSLAVIAVEHFQMAWQKAYEPHNQGRVLVVYFKKLKSKCKADQIEDFVQCAVDRI